MQSQKAGRQTPTNTGANLSDTWLDKQDLKQQLHISDSTIQRWRDEGVMPFTCLGGKIFYRKSVIEALLLRNEQVRTPRMKKRR